MAALKDFLARMVATLPLILFSMVTADWSMWQIAVFLILFIWGLGIAEVIGRKGRDQ